VASLHLVHLSYSSTHSAHLKPHASQDLSAFKYLSMAQVTQTAVLSHVAHVALHSTKQFPADTLHVAHYVLSQGSQVPSVWVNSPSIQEVHSPEVSQVTQLS
jgi:hypothetical protein